MYRDASTAIFFSQYGSRIRSSLRCPSFNTTPAEYPEGENPEKSYFCFPILLRFFPPFLSLPPLRVSLALSLSFSPSAWRAYSSRYAGKRETRMSPRLASSRSGRSTFQNICKRPEHSSHPNAGTIQLRENQPLLHSIETFLLME